MINYLKFKNFNNIDFPILTSNSIILFDTKESLLSFKQEFDKLVADINYEFIVYCTSSNEENVVIEEYVSCRDLSYIYITDQEQRILLTVEPISILSMEEYLDLWFVDRENNKWDKWNFTQYPNFKKYETKEEVYKFVCESKYGCNIKGKSIQG